MTTQVTDRSIAPVFNMMNDMIANYTTGNIDTNQRLRALNRAIEDVHRRLGLTCDEAIFNFNYSQTNMFTNLPADFDEPILLYYVNNAFNQGGQSGWQWDKYTRLLQVSGIGSGLGWGLGKPLSMFGQKLFSTTNINGSKQLIQIGSNIIQGSIINPYNTTLLTTAVGDATNLAVDNNVYYSNGGSLSFTINPTLGYGYGGILTTGFGIMNVQTALLQNGLYNLQTWLPTTNISAINLILTSSTGNYYTFTATAQNNGTPFVNSTLNNLWNTTQYQWSLVGITGSPNSQAITSYQVNFVEGPSFGSTSIPYFRINNFTLIYPDNMNLIYYSQFKGTDSTGTINKFVFDQLTDLPNFMQFYPDFINMVALRAAYILMPQLSADKDFMAQYKKDYDEQISDWGKIYPRKRCVNLGGTILRRP